MEGRTKESEYVVENLCRARQEVVAHPEWFDPGAVERIDKALAHVQDATQSKAA